jgi:hypothetical protein
MFPESYGYLAIFYSILFQSLGLRKMAIVQHYFMMMVMAMILSVPGREGRLRLNL